MTFSEPIPKKISTTGSSKPNAPTIEIKNPLEREVFINLLQIFPSTNFGDKGRLQILVNGVSIFNNSDDATFFSNFKSFSVPLVANQLDRSSSIEIFAWNGIDSTLIEATVLIFLSEVNEPQVVGSIPNQQTEVTIDTSDLSKETTQGTVKTNLDDVKTKLDTLDTDLDTTNSNLATTNTNLSTVNTNLTNVKTKLDTLNTSTLTLDPKDKNEVTAEGTKVTADGGSGITATIYTCPSGKIAIIKRVESRVRATGSASDVHILIRGLRIATWAIDSGNPEAYNTSGAAQKAIAFSNQARKVWINGTYPEFNITYEDLEGEVLIAGETVAYDGNFSSNFNATVDFAITIEERDV